MRHDETAMHMLLSADFEAAFSGYEALELSTDSIINCKWIRLQILIARNSKGHILSLPPSSNSCHSSSAYYIWAPFNTSSRGTQSFTTKLLSESLPPSSLLEILFNTPCCVPLAKYCLDQKACCFLRPLLCPSQVFLGQDQRINNSLCLSSSAAGAALLRPEQSDTELT